MTGLIGAVNFLSAFGGAPFLIYFGRKSIMVVGSFLMSIALISLGVSFQLKQGVLEVVFVLTYLALFQTLNGTATWVYIAEITQTKAMSMCSMTVCLTSFIISAVVPPVIKAIGDENKGYIFIFCGIT